MLCISVALFFLNIPVTIANDLIEFKYFFSERFYYGENPLGKEEDPHLTKTKEAIEMAFKVWEKATRSNIVFILADSLEKADIIFEGWSEKGPNVSVKDEIVCIDEYGDLHLFSEVLTETHGFTIFEDCNTVCTHSDFHRAADADSGHRARIFFNLKNKAGKTATWYYIKDKDKVHYTEAERDIIRIAAHEIGHALGFCGHPDENAQDCNEVPECKKNSASIMCKNQVRCYQEGEDGDVSLGGLDDIDSLGVRDLTVFDKGRIVEKFFNDTKVLYGRVKDADGKPIPDTVVATVDEKLTAKTDDKGIYSLWRIQPGTYTEKGQNPETGQTIGEIITITETAPNIIVKDFKFIQDPQNVLTKSQIIPSSGTPDDKYSLEATFAGYANYQPALVKLFVDGSEVHQFSAQTTNDQPIYAFSYYSLTNFGFGTHYYEFKAANNEGNWQQTSSGSFLVKSPSDTQFVLEANPKTVSVGKNNYTTISAWLKDNKGMPLQGETIIFRTSFPGFFTPSNGKAITDSKGEAKISFSPVSSGNAIITAIPPYGPSASTNIACTSPAARLSFIIKPLGDNSFKITSHIEYFSDKRPAVGEAVKWRLRPSTDLAWTKNPDQITDSKGKVNGIFSVDASESIQVSVTVTHIPTGISKTGTFALGGPEGSLIMPWKNLAKPIEKGEWSSNGYFAVTQRKGSGLSIYRVSDWKKVWNEQKDSGNFHSFFFSPDGHKLVMSRLTDKDEITILNVLEGNIEQSWDMIINGEPEAVKKSFGWQGNDIYTIHNDNAIRKWSSSGKLKMTFSHNAEIQELRFNPVNDAQFAAIDKYGELRLWDTSNPSPVKTVKVEPIPTGNLKCLAWSHDGTNLSIGSGIADSGMIYTFDTSNWSKSGFDLQGLGNVNSLDFNNDSSLLAVGHDKGLIIFNTNTDSIEYYNTDSVDHVRWNPDGSILAAGGQIYAFDEFSFNPPSIEISDPQNGSSFTTRSMNITGKISDPQNIRAATVSVNQGKPIELLLTFDGSFNQRIDMTNEKNTVLIQAQDIMKNKSSMEMTIKYLADSIPPILTEPFIDPGIGLKETKFNLSVRTHDGDSGINASKVTANIKSSEGNFIETVQLYDDGHHGDKDPGDGVFGNSWHSSKTYEGLHSIDYYAFDKAGNSGNIANSANFFVYDKPIIKKVHLSVTKPLSTDQVTINADITDKSGIGSADLFYSTTSGSSWNFVPMSSSGTTYKGTIPAQDMGAVYYKIKARDVHGYSNESSAYAYSVHDSTRPIVRIQKPATVETAITSEPFTVISGQAVNAGGFDLKSVICNTGSVNTGTLEEWSFNVPLTIRVNTITIVAEAKNGMLATDSIDITYSPKLATLVFSPAAPHVSTDPISVTIKSSDKGASIHFTTNNKEPTEASPVLISPILVTKETTIKAKSYKNGWTPSATVIGAYSLSKLEMDFKKEKTNTSGKTTELKEKPESYKNLTIQVAAFRDKKFADNMVEQLKKKGYSAYIVSRKSPGKISMYKVRIGSFKNRTEVESTLNRLKKDKIKAIIVVNRIR